MGIGTFGKTSAQLQREWAADRAATADALGITEDQATAVLEALPYSCIPTWVDVVEVVRMIREPNTDGE